MTPSPIYYDEIAECWRIRGQEEYQFAAYFIAENWLKQTAECEQQGNKQQAAEAAERWLA
jgi:hypothetical protein